ncbi:alpha-1,2-mannosyltransferase [Propionicimonas paludicola]|uniref:Alpha-1,2-mannosyltransferase n=1 Tax=Propionicimonas paludicola TaxID=185243 RepID=A0A2A9CQ70_9ACTN|nr:glycosyltransferase 87 family protein [Propionicimonas paludicola]PFG15689.1 alpha-1,2-mannosyltransferase [Propionicimonas paludicola]
MTRDDEGVLPVDVTPSQRVRILAAAATVIALAAAVILVLSMSAAAGPGLLGDLEIYRGAISYAVGGGDLYEWVYQHPTVHGLGFTYPPFAAVAMSWLVLVPMFTAKVIWTVLTFALAAACCWLLASQASHLPGTRPAPTPESRLLWTALAALLFIFGYPFLHNLAVGQASLFVIGLALFDHRLPRRWQGVLVGLAAAIKLTPLIFIPYYLITRQWRQAATSAGVFLAATGLTWVLFPAASASYWFDKLWQTGRVGRTDSTVNKSLLGFLSRLLPDGAATTIPWLVLAAAVALFAYWRASKALAAGDELGAVLLVGSLSVAVSPISWPHHELWLALVACWWLMQRGWLPSLLTAVLAVILVGYPWYDDYVTMSPALAIGVELPALAVLLVIGFGSRPRLARVRR